MTEKRFENRLNKKDIKFNTQNPIWDNIKEDAFNVFEMIDMLNNLLEENEQLKKENSNLKEELWEAQTEYIHERYFDNPIREKECINELKEDFKRGYWND